jgi:hypothetical protein
MTQASVAARRVCKAGGRYGTMSNRFAVRLLMHAWRVAGLSGLLPVGHQQPPGWAGAACTPSHRASTCLPTHPWRHRRSRAAPTPAAAAAVALAGQRDNSSSHAQQQKAPAEQAPASCSVAGRRVARRCQRVTTRARLWAVASSHHSSRRRSSSSGSSHRAGARAHPAAAAAPPPRPQQARSRPSAASSRVTWPRSQGHPKAWPPSWAQPPCA